LRGYRAALEARGLAFDPSLIFRGWGRRQTGLDALDAALALPDPPTAAACLNDVTAFGAMLGLFRRGLTPGRDLALVGYDDTLEASQWEPGLTSMRHSTPPGPVAAELLFARLADPRRPCERRAIAPTLVVRGTSQPPGR
jgi:LacI family transcriptional regulator